MGGPLSNGVANFSSIGPFILYAFVMGNRMLSGDKDEGTGMTFKQELNRTRSFQRGREKEGNTKMHIKYYKIPA